MSKDTADYSFSRPNLAELKAAGVKYVMRYLSPIESSKNVTRPEIDSIHENGMGVGFVFEWYAGRAKEGRAAGETDGHTAANLAAQLGIPANVPIFAAIDYDAPESDQEALNEYIDGFASILGGERGEAAYGGYWIIKRLFDAGKIKFGWQTYAWSGGNWDERAQLRQTLNGQSVAGGQIDYDETQVDPSKLFWMPDNQAAPAPVPAPVVPEGSHGYAMQRGDTFWGLEAANGWTHGTLQRLNPQWIGRESQIPMGTVIQLPGAPAAEEHPAPQYTPLGRHQIVAGDTFSGLDQANGWPQGTTQGLNPGLNPRTLQLGSWINVPAGGSVPVAPKQATHTIEDGDTFWGLEVQHGWAHGTLQHLNPNVNPNTLQLGSQINIPA